VLVVVLADLSDAFARNAGQLCATATLGPTGESDLRNL
jgi:hypothetical protein